MNFSNLLFNLYKLPDRRVKALVLKVIRKIEGGEFYSVTLRKIFKEIHNIEIGMYTHGGCFNLKQIHPFTKFGRYCSIASKIRVLNRDHPLNFKSSHAFFFNSKLGYCTEDIIKHTPLEIGSDVWIGHNAVILPVVKRIGHGAVIGASTVVSKDIPPYAVVVGYPARIVKYRFDKDTIEKLLENKWWEKPVETLNMAEFSSESF